MNRYPVGARLAAEKGTFRTPKPIPTGLPVREAPKPSALQELLGVKPAAAFLPTTPEMDRILRDVERALPNAALRGLRYIPWLARFHPMLRWLFLLKDLYDLLEKPPPAADAGLSPAGWEQIGGCENNGWGVGSFFKYTFAQTPFDSVCSTTTTGLRHVLPADEGAFSQDSTAWYLTWGIVRRRLVNDVGFDPRSGWKLKKPEAPTRLRYPAPDIFEPEPSPSEFVPQIDPWSQPAPGRTTPRPVPLPYIYVPELPDAAPDGTPVRGPAPSRGPSRVPTPAPSRGPETHPEPGTAPGPSTRPSPKPIPIPAPWPAPGTAPGEAPAPAPGPGSGPSKVPSTSVAIEPGTAPQVYRSQHFMRPAKARSKERKLKWKYAGYVLNVVNPYTEFCDVVDALYQALPKELRWQHKLSFWQRGLRTPRCNDKAGFVYAHYDEIDLEEAMKNLIVNEIGDRTFGTLSKKEGESWRKLGRAPVGPGFGSRAVFGVTRTNLG